MASTQLAILPRTATFQMRPTITARRPLKQNSPSFVGVESLTRADDHFNGVGARQLISLQQHRAIRSVRSQHRRINAMFTCRLCPSVSLFIVGATISRSIALFCTNKTRKMLTIKLAYLQFSSHEIRKNCKEL